MKFAVPIALVALSVAVVVALMWRLPWHPRTSAEAQADHDQVAAAEQRWFARHAEAKAEGEQLEQKNQQAEKAKGTAWDAEAQTRRDLEAQREKLKAEVINADPTIEAAYNRLAYDRFYHGVDSGNEELAAQYGQVGRLQNLSRILGLLLVTIYPVATIALGLFLLFRPPGRAGAHLYLVFTILPTVYAAPLLFRCVVEIYLWRFSEIGNPLGPAEMLKNGYDSLAKLYLWCFPGLLLYFMLLFRIHFQRRHESGLP